MVRSSSAVLPAPGELDQIHRGDPALFEPTRGCASASRSFFAITVLLDGDQRPGSPGRCLWSWSWSWVVVAADGGGRRCASRSRSVTLGVGRHRGSNRKSPHIPSDQHPTFWDDPSAPGRRRMSTSALPHWQSGISVGQVELGVGSWAAPRPCRGRFDDPSGSRPAARCPAVHKVEAEQHRVRDDPGQPPDPQQVTWLTRWSPTWSATAATRLSVMASSCTSATVAPEKRQLFRPGPYQALRQALLKGSPRYEFETSLRGGGLRRTAGDLGHNSREYGACRIDRGLHDDRRIDHQWR